MIGPMFHMLSQSSASLDYCDVEGGTSGINLNDTGSSYTWSTGCYDMDPLFVDPANGDYHLQSAVGRWDEAINDWVADAQTSPAIDTGNPVGGIEDEPDPDGYNLRKNLGAYGGTAQASQTPEGWSLLCDVNNDGMVDFAEFALLAAGWQQEAQSPADGDFNVDQYVSALDMVMLCEEWLGTTGWGAP